jgi:hypothetical protein
VIKLKFHTSLRAQSVPMIGISINISRRTCTCIHPDYLQTLEINDMPGNMRKNHTFHVCFAHVRHTCIIARNACSNYRCRHRRLFIKMLIVGLFRQTWNKLLNKYISQIFDKLESSKENKLTS